MCENSPEGILATPAVDDTFLKKEKGKRVFIRTNRNGPCYVSGELKRWLGEQQIEHTRGTPYHPMIQGKIERYHRSMKNVVKLENYYCPWELEQAIGQMGSALQP